MANLIEDLKLLIRTRHALVTLQTLDEAFASRQVLEAGREMDLPVLEWSISEGLRRVVPIPGGRLGGTESLAGALKFILHNDAINIYLLKDALRFLNDPATERLLREVALAFVRDRRTVFLVDPGGELPSSLHGLSVPYELNLPDLDEIRELVKQTFLSLTRFGEKEIRMTPPQFNQFLDNLRGLTRMEISQVMADAVLGDGLLGEDDVHLPIRVKRHRLRQTGVLDYIPPPETAPEVGGMDSLRGWLRKRSRAFTSEAIAFGLEPPRGILMLGVQGCGKSLMARYVAAAWRMPLLRMDVGALYDKYIGETERHLRQAFKIASAVSPCVLWIDEIEKAFASASAGAASDGGLSQRMFGQLLTWMQDHEDPVFIVATANDIAALPPELMRKGRFDEIFFVDLPGSEARRSIFSIHLSKRKRSPEKFDLDRLVEASEGFSGAEIEQAIVSALFNAFSEERDLDSEDILKEIRSTRPLSVLMAEKVQSLRDWARDRCVRAD